MTAQHEPDVNPPPCLNDPYVRRRSLERAHWVRAIRGHVKGMANIAIAHTLAGYANRDGANAHPGVERLAVDVDASTKTVQRSLTWLADHGFITRTRRGSRKSGEADVYLLSIPAPVAVQLGMWGDEPLWMERPDSEDRSRYTRPVLGDTDVTYKRFLGDKTEFLGDISDVLGDAGVPPPGLTTPGINHHSDVDTSASPHGRRPRTSPPDLLDRDTAHNRISDAVDGYGPGEEALADAMIEAGHHPKAITNTIQTRRARTP